MRAPSVKMQYKLFFSGQLASNSKSDLEYVIGQLLHSQRWILTSLAIVNLFVTSNTFHGCVICASHRFVTLSIWAPGTFILRFLFGAHPGRFQKILKTSPGECYYAPTKISKSGHHTPGVMPITDFQIDRQTEGWKYTHFLLQAKYYLLHESFKIKNSSV